LNQCGHFRTREEGGQVRRGVEPERTFSDKREVRRGVEPLRSFSNKSGRWSSKEGG